MARTEDRQRILRDYEKRIGVMPSRHILRSFGEYDRYTEADALTAFFADHGVDMQRMRVMDYGSGVGDYGVAFARAGAAVTYCDIPYMLDFVAYRHELDPSLGAPQLVIAEEHKAALDMDMPAGGYDLAIFGEVLEHLDDPHALLERFADAGTTYLFTSSYPYRSDDPADPYWTHGGHTDEARLLQTPCRALLEGRYMRSANFGGQLNLWIKKP